MIQFNLLPDVKIAFLRAQRIKRLVIFTSTIAAIVALAIFLILVTYVEVIQKKHLSDLSRDIRTNQSQLGGTSNLNKILTVQNQLSSLPALDAQKPVATRLFNDITSVTPAKASISEIDVDFTQYTIKIDGNADSLKTVNQYVDTLKFTTYSQQSSGSNRGNGPKAFSNVVLNSFGIESGGGANYEIDLNFDPAIFSATNSGKLYVPPNTITTRSITQQPAGSTSQPTDLFKEDPGATSSNTSGSQQ